jgi:hypothetical protein
MNVLIFCRRFIRWEQGKQESIKASTSDFVRHWNLDEMFRGWQQVNPGITLHAYRAQLQQLALASWQRTGAEVALLELDVDAPHDPGLPADLFDAVRSADWVIPIDDDDWLAPHLALELGHASAQGYWMATWPSRLIHIKGTTIEDNQVSEIVPHTAGSERPTLVSCSAAVSKHLIRQLNDSRLVHLLMQHGTASDWHGVLPKALCLSMKQTGAVHLRHQATVGSGFVTDLDRRIGVFLNEQTKLTSESWACDQLQELNKIHAEYAYFQKHIFEALNQTPEPLDATKPTKPHRHGAPTQEPMESGQVSEYPHEPFDPTPNEKQIFLEQLLLAREELATYFMKSRALEDKLEWIQKRSLERNRNWGWILGPARGMKRLLRI